MGILDKLKFWKKDDFDAGFGADTGFGGGSGLGSDFGLGKDSTSGLGGSGDLPGTDLTPKAKLETDLSIRGPGYEEVEKQRMMPSPLQSSYERQGYAGSQGYERAPQMDIISKDIEIISSKLDALRASIESINQRLANLERLASEQYSKRRGEW